LSPSGESVEELMDGLARCGSVRAFDEPIPKVSGVTNGNTRSQPRG
jgi:hypothetical protein